MSSKACQKIIITLFLVLFYSSTPLFGQLKNFGTKAKIKPEPTYFFNTYTYYDLIREKGIGVQYHFLPSYSIDISVYSIAPNNYLRDKVLQWDYYDLKGYGFSIRPKFHFSSLGNWYVSPNISFEWLNHGKTWVEYYYGRGSEITNNLEETKGKAFTIGISFGRKINMNRFYIEPFVGFGITDFKGEKTIYEINYRSYYSTVDNPEKERYNQDFLQLFAGIKLGLSFKKYKKHIAIDKKFDEVYIPKANSLKNYFKTVNFEDKTIKKDLRRAYVRYEGLNRNALVKYKRYYRDTAMFYNKMNFLFHRIDSLIAKGNK
jgi:hypothetical protein